MSNTLHIDELKHDAKNANRGTYRGKQTVAHSLRTLGTGRSVLLDKHGVLIAGNKTAEAAKAEGIQEVLVIPSDGKQLIAVQRTDLDLATDQKARDLALADNRTAELGLEWDPTVLQQMSADVSLMPYFSPHELTELTIPEPDKLRWEERAGNTPPSRQIPPVTAKCHICPRTFQVMLEHRKIDTIVYKSSWSDYEAL